MPNPVTLAPRELLPAPANVAEAMKLATTLSNSGLVPKAFQRHPEDVFVCMLWSHTLGIPVVQGLQYIAVINGKPSMYGDGLLACVMASGKLESIDEEFLKTEEGLTAKCTVRRVGIKSPVVSLFSEADAKRAGLLGKAGPWTLYPKRMLKMRARAFALRDLFPDVLAGMASAEEMGDVVVAEEVKPAATKPARKFPKKKSEPAEEITPAPETAPVPDEKPEPAPEATAESTAEVPENEETSAYYEVIDAAQTIDELRRIYKGIPAEERGVGSPLYDAFMARVEALKAEEAK